MSICFSCGVRQISFSMAALALAQSKLVARTVEVPAFAHRLVAAHALAVMSLTHKGVTLFISTSPGSFHEVREES
ncbi:exported hypothetical protein [Pseudomonas sp. IT-P44]